MSKMAQLSNLPQDWDTSNGGFPESSIPNWQEAIPKSQDIADNALVRLFKEEWFTSLRVEVCVCPKERSERPYLIPPNQHFRVWVSEETSNVSYQIHGFVNLSGILCGGKTYIRRSSFRRYCWTRPFLYRRPYVPRCRGCLPST
jgi:hypothetical protein